MSDEDIGLETPVIAVTFKTPLVLMSIAILK